MTDDEIGELKALAERQRLELTELQVQVVQAQGDLAAFREYHNNMEAMLRKSIVDLREQVDSLVGPANAYNDLKDQILANPTLQAEWDRFVMFLKLGADEYLQLNGAYQ